MTNDTPKRYLPVQGFEDGCSDEDYPSVEMREDDEGPWVSHEAFEAMKRERDAARRERDEAYALAQYCLAQAEVEQERLDVVLQKLTILESRLI